MIISELGIVHSSSFYSHLPAYKMEQSVPKRRHINFRRRVITQKKAYNIRNTAKARNQENIIYSECGCVALVIRHVKRMRHIISSPAACPVLPYFFPRYLINGTIFGKEFILFIHYSVLRQFQSLFQSELST